jgi:TctA family transporter
MSSRPKRSRLYAGNEQALTSSAALGVAYVRLPVLEEPYSLRRRLAARMEKHPEQFGKGAIEGVAAPESATMQLPHPLSFPFLLLASREMRRSQ